MPEEKLVVMVTALQQAGIVPAALTDALSRGEREFVQDTHLSPFAVKEWVEGLRATCPHFFGVASSATPASAIPAAHGRGSRRPERVQPSPEQTIALNSLPPTQRMTAYRELQQREKG